MVWSSLLFKFIDLIKSYKLHNIFFEPTIITAPSVTCIDNIFTNVKPTSYLIGNVIDSDLLVSFEKTIKGQRKWIVFISTYSGWLERFKNNS